MITTPEIIFDLFSFLDKDQIERLQLVNQFWNNVIILHNNILPLRQLYLLDFYQNRIDLKEETGYAPSIKINFDGINLSKEYVSSQYSQLSIDEVLKNLNDVVFGFIQIQPIVSDHLDDLLNLMKLVTAKTGGRFRGRHGEYFMGRFGSKLNEMFDNYIIVDVLVINDSNSYIREVCANPEIVQLPSTPKEIRLTRLNFNEDEEVLNFTCNSKLNGANRLTIDFRTSETNYGNFIRQWFELYRTHKNPISLVGKFKLIYPILYCNIKDNVLDAVKTFLNSTQLRVRYSLETKEFHFPNDRFLEYFIRRCVLHETDSYALVIEMVYEEVTDMSSINASDLDQPPYNKMESISFCVKSLWL